MKHNCYMNYEIEVEFSNVTSKELGEILALDLGEMREALEYCGYTVPKIDRIHEYFDDGYPNPVENAWTITYKVNSVDRIGKDALKWYNEEFVKERIDLAEEVAKYIMTKLNLTEEES